MRGIATAQTIVRRSSACLARQSTGASAGSRAFATAAAPHVQPSTASLYSTAPLLPALCSRRCFSQTAVRPKKAKKEKNAASPSPSSSSSRKAQKPESSADGDEDDGSGGNHPAADPADPFNFADVESRWQRTESHHEDKFKELRRSINGGAGDGGSGGVDVEAIGQTKVSIKAEDLKGDPNAAAAASAETPLSQLALVIPRAGGRVVELRMHSPAYKKAIVSAVQKHSAIFRGQQPQPDPNDELVLLIKIGAAAGGAGGAASLAAEHSRRINDLANGWRTQIRKATSRRQKTHQTWKKDKTVNPDDLRRLDRDLLKGQEKRMAKVDSEEKDTLRRIEQASKR
ncbi:ribosomal recycling factor [Ophiostoma piceae UAMH 11346]|uniref:Ribosomal recycling factor n=1 Tax=Ophiostoma piceae (strain UAMH 11346) TaxID=1262450 RepID=S3D9C0_OPHP1|nr:ribosomal recycling factor [Ophiostoma piceae UAMH 11346]